MAKRKAKGRKPPRLSVRERWFRIPLTSQARMQEHQNMALDLIVLFAVLFAIGAILEASGVL